MTTHTLGFIGAGNMAEAIAKAAVEQGVLPAGQIIASDPTRARLEVFQSMGVAVAADNAQVIRSARQVLLAVKPQTFENVVPDLRAYLTGEHVLISIMAGMRAGKIADALGKPVRLVRVMPNTPMMAGAGMAAVALGPDAREGDGELTLKLFRAGGEAIEVDEEKMDAVTAVSGSGPAYVFYLAEAMEQAAREMGLGEHATLLVEQTIFGAAKLLRESNDPAAELRRKVTSPGGTTQAAISHLDANHAADVIVAAIKAAQKRSEELGA